MKESFLHPLLRQSLFITGTDTGVGKTTVAVGLLKALVGHGLRAAGMKPVAAGAVMTSHGLRNDDALDLAAAGNVRLPYHLTNPCCLVAATSPHLAARWEGVRIDIGTIKAAFAEIGRQSDVIVVEGAGGWFVPIGDGAPGHPGPTMEDIAVNLGLPVVLVVGVRLGCINHALLSAAAIARSGLPLVGWIANPVDPDFVGADSYVEALSDRLFAPLLWRAPRVILPGQ